MKSIAYVVALTALAAAASAACEFPYYPEYADVFGRYDEVTPEMAIAGIGAWPEEAIFAEALLLRDARGMPFGYMIEAFPPEEDRELVARWNVVIAKLNAGGRVISSSPASYDEEAARRLWELSEELAGLLATERVPARPAAEVEGV